MYEDLEKKGGRKKKVTIVLRLSISFLSDERYESCFSGCFVDAFSYEIIVSVDGRSEGCVKRIR
jgi:hypothetical protein